MPLLSTRRIAGATLAASLLIVGPFVQATLASHARAAALNIYVDPAHGSDRNGGADLSRPLRTIQAALNEARPGVRIHLAAGVYHEEPHTVANGTGAAPIVLEGPESGLNAQDRYKAVLYGTGRIFNLNNSHYVLRGFTIEGQEALTGRSFPTALSQVTLWKNNMRADVRDGRLVYIGSADSARHLTDITLDDMYLHGAGGECVRIRNASTDVSIRDSSISYCGLYPKASSDRFMYHNGEGIYVGTSPKSTDQPMHADDSTHGISIVNDVIHTYGSECVDVKENAYAVKISGVDCADNAEPLASGGSDMEIRGHNTVVSSSTIQNSLGYGVKIRADSERYNNGGNSVIETAFSGNAGPALDVRSPTQGDFCGDSFDVSTPVSGIRLAPTAPCSSPSASEASASPSAVPTEAILSWQAESGSVTSPMTVQSSSKAQAGHYIEQTSRVGRGFVTYEVEIPANGTYRLDGRVIAPDDAHNSFYVAWDYGHSAAWMLPADSRNWTWVSEGTASLSAGVHRLTLTRRESGAKVDAFRLIRVK